MIMCDNSRRVNEVINKILEIGSLQGKKTVFLIGNTTKKNENDYYLTPVRNFKGVVVSGVVVSSEKTAKNIAKIADGKVDYIFVDSEKKIRDMYSVSTTKGNIQRAVRESVFSSTLITYKANDLTVDAVDAFIAEYYADDIAVIGGKKIGIIGAGNIGFKVGLKLVERGADVKLFRRSRDKLNLAVDCINMTKSKYTAAEAYTATDVKDACINTNVVIGLTNAPVIDDKVIKVLDHGSLIIDAGKGSISKRAVQLAYNLGLDVRRLSVENSLEGMIVSLISTHKNLRYRTGRRNFHGIKVVSGSILAGEDEFVVDDFQKPKIVYGLGNGYGDFQRKLDESMKIKLVSLQNSIRMNLNE